MNKIHIKPVVGGLMFVLGLCICGDAALKLTKADEPVQQDVLSSSIDDPWARMSARGEHDRQRALAFQAIPFGVVLGFFGVRLFITSKRDPALSTKPPVEL